MSHEREIRCSAWGVLKLAEAVRQRMEPTADGRAVPAERWKDEDYDHCRDVQDALRDVERPAERAVRAHDRRHNATIQELVEKLQTSKTGSERQEVEDALVAAQYDLRDARRTEAVFVGDGFAVSLPDPARKWIRDRVAKLLIPDDLAQARHVLLDAIDAAKEVPAKEAP